MDVDDVIVRSKEVARLGLHRLLGLSRSLETVLIKICL